MKYFMARIPVLLLKTRDVLCASVYKNELLREVEIIMATEIR